MKKTKIKYIVANIMAPGIGHLAMKKWIRGILYLLVTIGCIVWLIISFALNIIGIYYSDMNTQGSSFDSIRLLISIFLPIGGIVSLWIFSYIDLFFFCSVPIIKEDSTEGKS